jgi:2-iminoacetate synthase
MSFSSEFDSLTLAELSAYSQNATAADVEAALARSDTNGKRISLADFAALISPAAAEPVYLEALARQSHTLTKKYFGRVMRFFAPLYVSTAGFRATIPFCV